MSRHLQMLPQAGCNRCAFLGACGGRYGQGSLFGCFGDCGACGDDCDWTCPSRDDFVDRVREVGGLEPRWEKPLVPLAGIELPPYLPMIRHGYKRAMPFSGTTVALALEDVLKIHAGKYRPVRESADGVRFYFQVAPEAQILIVGVAKDKIIERYWALRRKFNVAASLRALNVMGVTVPNYSVFGDGPRTQVLWNRRRMDRVAEELSAAGVAIVPHLNAAQPEDWRDWLGYMQAYPAITYVAKEFRTGLRRRELGLKAIRDLADLQDRLGRPLHPIVIGGTGYAPAFGRYFSRVTFIDSDPFMKAVNRRMHQGRKYEFVRHDGMVDEYLEINVRRHTASCVQRLGRSIRDHAARDAASRHEVRVLSIP